MRGWPQRGESRHAPDGERERDAPSRDRYPSTSKILSDTASPATGDDGIGEVIILTLAASAPLTVTGTPTLTLNDGGVASYVSGSGTGSLVFSTMVAAGQNIGSLAVTGVTLPGGATIQDGNGNDTALDGAKASFTGLQIDTTPPILSAGLHYDSGVSSSDHVTNDATLALTGEYGAKVTISDGSTVLSTGVVTNLVVNPTFSDLTGWTSTDTSRTGSSVDTEFFANDGIAFSRTTPVGFVEYKQNGPVESLSQTLTGLSVGSTYTLSYREDARAGNATPFNGSGTPNLYATPIVEALVGGAVIVAAHTEAPPRDGNGILHNETATFVATAATETLEFRTVGLATGTGTDAIANYTGVSVRAGADGYSDLAQLFPEQLADGSHTLTVSETDAAGNTTSVPVSFTLDTTVPTIISDDPSHPSGTFSTGQDLYFTLVASEALTVTGTPTLTLNDGGTATYFGGSGNAYLYFHTAVAAGQNAAVLAVTGVALNGGTIQDLAGNDAVLTGANATFAGLQVDTSPLLLVVGLSTDTGVSSTDHVTSDATLFVTGKGGATVTISDGSTVLDTATVNDLANRNFVVNPTFGPANGDAGYGDVDGWSSTDTSRTGSNDDTQPFWDNGIIPDGTATVGFVQYQQGDPVESLSQTLTGLSPGSTYVLSYFENTRTYDAVPVVEALVDGTVVVAAHYGGPVGGASAFRLETATFVATAATETLEFRTLGLGPTAGTYGTDGTELYTDVSVSAPTLSFPEQLPDGSYTLTVSETDVAGNTASVPVSFRLDTTPPAVTAGLVSYNTGPAADPTTSSPMLSGTTDPSGTVTVSNGTTLLGTAVADALGTWTFTPTGLSDGPHTLTASDTDPAGNTGSASVSFTLAPDPGTNRTVTGTSDTGLTSVDSATTLTSSAVISNPGGPGVTLLDGGTLTDDGSITGGNGVAVQFGPTGDDKVILNPGGSFNGSVIANPSGNNTLTLGAGTGASTIEALTAQFQNFQTITVAAGADWTLTGTNTFPAGITFDVLGTLVINGVTVNDGTFTTDPSAITYNAPVSGTGEIDISAGSSVAFNASVSSDQSVVFEADTGTLALGSPSEFGATVFGTQSGDLIDLTSLASETAESASLTAGNVLTVVSASGTLAQIQLDPHQSFSGQEFHVASDSASGTLLSLVDDTSPCYCPGTLICTLQGERAVETLRRGDVVLTADGVAETIRWIGRRSYAGRFIAGKHLMLPVTIQAGALGGGVPHTDLVVSPGHGMWVCGQLVPSWRLVNGATITQAEAVDQVTYIHVELARHALLLANGAPAESYLDEAGLRGQFHNAPEFSALFPDAPAMAPLQARLEDGFALQAIRERLAIHAGLPLQIEPVGPLRGYVDQAEAGRVCGWAQDTLSPEEPVVLEILVDGRPVICVLANGWRADLRRAGLGSGCHAFAVELALPDGSRVLVRRAADRALLATTTACNGAARAA